MRNEPSCDKRDDAIKRTFTHEIVRRGVLFHLLFHRFCFCKYFRKIENKVLMNDEQGIFDNFRYVIIRHFDAFVCALLWYNILYKLSILFHSQNA